MGKPKRLDDLNTCTEIFDWSISTGQYCKNQSLDWKIMTGFDPVIFCHFQTKISQWIDQVC